MTDFHVNIFVQMEASLIRKCLENVAKLDLLKTASSAVFGCAALVPQYSKKIELGKILRKVRLFNFIVF